MHYSDTSALHACIHLQDLAAKTDKLAELTQAHASEQSRFAAKVTLALHVVQNYLLTEISPPLSLTRRIETAVRLLFTDMFSCRLHSCIETWRMPSGPQKSG